MPPLRRNLTLADFLRRNRRKRQGRIRPENDNRPDLVIEQGLGVDATGLQFDVDALFTCDYVIDDAGALDGSIFASTDTIQAFNGPSADGIGYINGAIQPVLGVYVPGPVTKYFPVGRKFKMSWAYLLNDPRFRVLLWVDGRLVGSVPNSGGGAASAWAENPIVDVGQTVGGRMIGPLEYRAVRPAPFGAAG